MAQIRKYVFAFYSFGNILIFAFSLVIHPNGTVSKFAQPLTAFPENIRDKNGTLYFHNTRFEDAGLYTCVAVSLQGVINETIKVEVFGKSIFLNLAFS